MFGVLAEIITRPQSTLSSSLPVSSSHYKVVHTTGRKMGERERDREREGEREKVVLKIEITKERKSQLTGFTSRIRLDFAMTTFSVHNNTNQLIHESND